VLHDAWGLLGSSAGARGGRGKRKKQVPDAAAAAAAGAAGDAEEEVDVMALGAQEETPESWQALLAGLSEICHGIGMALQHGLCE
jgi:hypothetical protein